jgi:hypothetical protein
MSDMLADTLDELHAMAATVGLQRRWFQDGGKTPHYDLCQEKRRLAIAAGAVEIDRRQTVTLIRAWRARMETQINEKNGAPTVLDP